MAPLALLLALSLVSCTKSGKGRSAAAAPLPPPAPAPASVPSPALPGAPANTPPGPANPSTTILLAREQSPPPAAAKKDTGVASLLTLGARDQRILPEDFKIGPVADALAGDADTQQVLKAANAFLARLAAGKVEPSALAPEAQSRISDMIAFAVDHGSVPRSWRLGSFRKRETGEMTAAVRLFGAVGTSEGELTLEHSARQWLISDFQISLGALQVKSEKPKDRFFPSSYRWMLEE